MEMITQDLSTSLNRPRKHKHVFYIRRPGWGLGKGHRRDSIAGVKVDKKKPSVKLCRPEQLVSYCILSNGNCKVLFKREEERKLGD